MQVLHPALIEELNRKRNLSHPDASSAAIISLLLEVGTFSILVATGLFVFSLIPLVYAGYTIPAVLYLLFWSEDKKRQALPCMRIGFIVFGILLFIPLIYPGGTLLVLFMLFGGFLDPIMWLIILGVFFVYFHIVSFMVAQGKDYHKMMSAQL